MSPAEQGGRSLVVCVVVRVDHVGDLVGQAVGGGDLVHGAPDVVADVRGRVEITTPSEVVRNADM
jgi:hypothetical protein